MGKYFVLQAIFLCLCFVLINGTTAQENYCNETLWTRFHTPCRFCPSNRFIECPVGVKRLTTGRGTSDCSYTVVLDRGITAIDGREMHFAGCRHTCLEYTYLPKCCLGYWGFHCHDCPGGAENACNRNGVCNETLLGDGKCDCQENYSGFACEHCINSSVYGNECNKSCECMHGKCNSGIDGDGSCDCYSGFQGSLCDEIIPGCVNVTCQDYSRCREVNGTADCLCDVGYENADNVTYCVAVDHCRTSPCHDSALCMFTGPASFNCTCYSGYEGDGFVCDAIDPCQIDAGGCLTNTSTCTYDGPGQSHCDCLDGYENFEELNGCDLIDVCVYNSSHCDKNAKCSTIAPRQFECVCNEGYAGSGTLCYSNIVKRIGELNLEDDKLRGQLFLSKQLIETVYLEELTAHGPFTIFVPTDRGFRNILKATAFRDFLADEDTARQILRQHIIIGELEIEQLYNSTVFYTLQGVAAELQARNKDDSFRYRIHGAGNKGKVLKGDIIAANGVVHVINTLITNEPEVRGDPKTSILDLVQTEGRYNRLQTLIVETGLEDFFNEDNITVFVPLNSAWDNLPSGTLAYMQSEEGYGKLKLVLKHHIFPGRIEVTDLIGRDRIRSRAETSVDIVITGVGQIRLNGNVNISQTDIPAKNGLFYHVESVLLPGGLQAILPNRCDLITSRVIKGKCNPCQGDLKCPGPSDEPLDEISTGCFFWTKHNNRYISFRGCSRMCNRTYTTSRCCEGFYSYGCLPCPGGFQNPCSGKGKCSDGIYEKGACVCDENFSGPACDRCDKELTFGENCSQDCTCLNGICDNGRYGTGECKPSSCTTGYAGKNCDRSAVHCGFKYNYCSAHAMCTRVDNMYSCVCSKGYEGDGNICTEINPCQNNHGRCHSQATCTKTDPGMHTCECDEGWTGDGTYCSPVIYCLHQNDCHDNATCKTTEPGKYICVCLEGYFGNGTYCVPTNSCTIDNGGCLGKAKCVYTEPGSNNCTCPEDYVGNEETCYSTLDKEIEDHPNLTQVARLLKFIPDEDNILLSNDTYTIFVPSDDAMEEFLGKTTSRYWQKYENVLTMLSYHMMDGLFGKDLLKLMSQNYGKFDTLADGYFLHIIINNKGFFVSPRFHDGYSTTAEVVSADIPAANGYIHIIDKVLEPFIPETNPPLLQKFFSENPDYSIFAQWLDDKDLLKVIEDMEAYTLFVPTNLALQNYNKTVTTSFLWYYVLPEIRLTVSIDDGETIATKLGIKHQLKFTVAGRRISVNDIEILDADQLTEGGVVHGIKDLLMPILHICEITITTVRYGPCVRFCLGSIVKSSVCPLGYVPVDGVRLCRSRTTMRFVFPSYNCQKKCQRTEMKEVCCADYFGENCDECPNGPEEPCSGVGVCDDGRNGAGTCTCQPWFMGDKCELCIEGRVGPKCDIRTDSCQYRNGGCHEHALCDEVDGNITCRCKLGYLGDGHDCISPCDTHNGGCHMFATCSVQNNSILCECHFYYHGDGRISCKKTTSLCNIKNGGCSQNATCLFTPPEVTDITDGTVHCKCLRGFAGNGSLCNMDMMNTLEKLPMTNHFAKILNYGMTVGSERYKIKSDLWNTYATVTAFIPVSSSLKHVLMSSQDLKTHFVNNSIIHLSYPWLPGTPHNVTAESGEILLLTVSNETKQVYVNGIQVVEANIPCVNGMIHLIQSPLSTSGEELEEEKTEINIAVIVAPLVVIVLLAVLTISAVYLYRKSRTTGILEVVRCFRKGSDSSLAFARLSQHQDDDDDAMMQSADIDNPLYNVNRDFDSFQLLGPDSLE